MDKYDREKEIKASKQRSDDWCKQAKKSWEAYAQHNYKAGFGRGSGLYWSIIETMRPHLYFQRPALHVQRRISKRDSVNALAASMAETATEYMLDVQNFNKSMEQVVLDFLLTGRGVPWVLFERTDEPVKIYGIPSADPAFVVVNGQLMPREAFKEDKQGRLYFEQIQTTEERASVTRIHWKDYLEAEARQPDEIEWKARKIWLSREMAQDEFGKGILEKLDFSAGRSSGADSTSSVMNESQDFACILELWDREAGKVCYYSEDNKKLETKDPEFDLENFFPCPDALIATCPEDTIDPIPDFAHIQDDLETLEVLQERRHRLAEKIRMAGGYNGEFGAVFGSILESGEDKYYSIPNWPGFAQAGGFDGNIVTLPIDETAQALASISAEIQAVKQNIYETTGVSDLLRGVNDPRATAAAEELKGDYASTRLSERRKLVARMVRDTIRIVSEITVERVSPDRFLSMSGADLNDQNIQAAYQLLQNDRLRTFALEIETESTLKSDDRRDMRDTVEFMGQLQGAMAGFANALQTTPWMAEPLKEATMALVRKYKAGRGVEEKIEQSMEQAMDQQQQAAQQPPQPDPMQEALRAQIQAEQMKAQVAAQKLQLDAQKLQLEAREKEFNLFVREREVLRKEQELGLKAQDSAIKSAKAESDIAKTANDIQIDNREQRRKEIETSHEIATGQSIGVN